MPAPSVGTYFCDMPQDQREISGIICLHGYGFTEKNDDEWDFPPFEHCFVCKEIPEELYAKMETLVEWKKNTTKPIKETHDTHDTAWHILCENTVNKGKQKFNNLLYTCEEILEAQNDFHNELISGINMMGWEWRCAKLGKEFDSQELENRENRQNAHKIVQEAFLARLTSYKPKYKVTQLSTDWKHYLIDHKDENEFWIQKAKFALTQSKNASDANQELCVAEYRRSYKMAMEDYGQMREWCVAMTEKNKNLHPAEVPRHEKMRGYFDADYFDKIIKGLGVSMEFFEKLCELSVVISDLIDQGIKDMFNSDHISEDQMQQFKHQ